MGILRGFDVSLELNLDSKQTVTGDKRCKVIVVVEREGLTWIKVVRDELESKMDGDGRLHCLHFLPAA